MKSGAGLASYAAAQLGRPYWWGTFGQLSSRNLLNQKKIQYPEHYMSSDFERQLGQKVHDCVGLIKGYRWCGGPESEPEYKASEDVSVSGLYRDCGEKGGISTLPEEPGVCLFTANLGHVGVYMGSGRVVEAMGHQWGVVETALSRRNFTLWGKPDWISYEGGPGLPSQSRPGEIRPAYYYNYLLPLLKRGMRDAHVLSLRRLLGLKAGDYYGEETEKAVKNFQKQRGLLADGEAGIDTWTALLREE